MDYIKIMEQFHYYNIKAGFDSLYGEWAVSSEGDVVNCIYPYVILGIHLTEDNWTEIIKTKVWYYPGCDESLRTALHRANEILTKKK